MKKTILIMVAGLCMYSTAFAQQTFGINYSVAFPVSDLSDFTEPTSGRGVTLDYSYFIQSDIAIGASLGWQTFYEDRGYVTETIETETVSGNRYNYLNSVPFYVTGSYFLSTENDLQPFGSLGIGLVYNEANADVGLYRIEDETWHFSLRPEVGIQYPINYGFGVQASARYHYVANAGEIGSPSYFAITAGVIWKL